MRENTRAKRRVMAVPPGWMPGNQKAADPGKLEVGGFGAHERHAFHEVLPNLAANSADWRVPFYSPRL